jgi:hypothetical protein
MVALTSALPYPELVRQGSQSFKNRFSLRALRLGETNFCHFHRQKPYPVETDK